MNDEDHDDDEIDIDLYAAERELLETLNRIGEGPCKGCPFRQHCATEPAACSDYVDWVDGEKVEGRGAHARNPSRDLFDFIEGNAPLAVADEVPWTRRHVLAALKVEAHERARYQRGYVFPQRNLTAAQVRAYWTWLRDRGATVTVAALSVLLSRLGPVGFTDAELAHIISPRKFRV